MLYDTFLLRSWFTTPKRSACRDEYVELIDYLRANYSPEIETTDASRDLIDFMMVLDLLQQRKHLFYMFKLCCLCATSVSPDYSTVTFGSSSTSEFRSQFTDVTLPGQSYLTGVPGSLPSVPMRPICPNSRFSLLPSANQHSLPLTIIWP